MDPGNIVLLLLGARGQLVEDRLQGGPREHAQKQLDRGIRLMDLEVEPLGMLAQEARQIRRRGVRRIELRHRRGDEEQAQRSPG